MASDDHNEEFDSVRINKELIDASGTAHTGELADLADTGDGGSGGSVSVSDDGTVILDPTDDLNFGEFLTVSLDGDNTVTIDGVNTDTNTHINVENTDGTILVKNPNAVQAGQGLTFSDDGDNSVTIDTDGPVPELVTSGAVELDGDGATAWVDTGLTETGTKLTVAYGCNDQATVEHAVNYDTGTGTAKVRFEVVATGVHYTGPATVSYDILHWGTDSTDTPTEPTATVESSFEASDYTSIFTEEPTRGYHDRVSSPATHETYSMNGYVPSGNHYGMSAVYDPDAEGYTWNELYVRYAFRLASFTDWADSRMKVPGPANTENGGGKGGTASDGSNGWSARLTTDGRSYSGDQFDLMGYVYHMDMGGSYGESFNSTTLNTDQWYTIDQHVKINTFDSNGNANSDGEWHWFVDDTQIVGRTDMRWCDDVAAIKDPKHWFNVYFGGGTPAAERMDLYFDNYKLDTTDFANLGV